MKTIAHYIHECKHKQHECVIDLGNMIFDFIRVLSIC